MTKRTRSKIPAAIKILDDTDHWGRPYELAGEKYTDYTAVFGVQRARALLNSHLPTNRKDGNIIDIDDAEHLATFFVTMHEEITILLDQLHLSNRAEDRIFLQSIPAATHQRFKKCLPY